MLVSEKSTKILLDYHRVWRPLWVQKGVRINRRMIYQAGKMGAHSLPSSDPHPL